MAVLVLTYLPKNISPGLRRKGHRKTLISKLSRNRHPAPYFRPAADRGAIGPSRQLVRIRRYALELSEAFLPAAFRKLFGPRFRLGPSEPLAKWSRSPEVAPPHASVPSIIRGRIPWLTSKDMKGDYIWDTEEHITELLLRKARRISFLLDRFSCRKKQSADASPASSDYKNSALSRPGHQIDPVL